MSVSSSTRSQNYVRRPWPLMIFQQADIYASEKLYKNVEYDMLCFVGNIVFVDCIVIYLYVEDVWTIATEECTVYPKKYAHGFVVLCFVVVMQSFIMNSHEVFIHIHQGCFAGTGAIVRLPQCQ